MNRAVHPLPASGAILIVHVALMWAVCSWQAVSTALPHAYDSGAFIQLRRLPLPTGVLGIGHDASAGITA